MSKKHKLLPGEEPIKNPGLKYEDALRIEDEDYRVWVYHPTKEAKIVSAVGARDLLSKETGGWTMDPIKVSPDTIKDNVNAQLIVGMTGRYMNMLLMLKKVTDKDGLIELQWALFGKKSPKNINIENLKTQIRKLADEKGLIYDDDGRGGGEQSAAIDIG